MKTKSSNTNYTAIIIISVIISAVIFYFSENRGASFGISLFLIIFVACLGVHHGVQKLRNKIFKNNLTLVR